MSSADRPDNNMRSDGNTISAPRATLKLRSGTAARPRATVPPRPPPRQTMFITWRDGGHRPKKQHASLDAALTEADRLAKLYPGAVFRTFECRLVSLKQEPAADQP